MQVVRTYTPYKTRHYWANSPSVDQYREYYWVRGETIYYDDYDAYDDKWGDTSLCQGRRFLESGYIGDTAGPSPTWYPDVYSGNGFGAMADFRNISSGATLAAEMGDKTALITQVRIRLVRKSSPSGSKNIYIRRATGVTASNFPGSGAHSPNCGYSDDGEGLPIQMNYTDVGVNWKTTSLAAGLNLISWLIAGNAICIHHGMSEYAVCYGAGSNPGYIPLLEITTEEAPPNPSPSVPVLTQIEESITSLTHTFSWQTASDASGIFTPEELSYELEISTDGGTTWGATISVAAGTILQSVDLGEYFTLAAHSYYPNCKFRVRAVSPAYEENVYYSDWAESERFAIDYRIEMFLPILYDALHWVIPEHDFGDAFALKIVNKMRLRGKGGTCGVTPKMNGELGTRVEVELPDDPGFVDVPLYAKGRTIGFIIDNGPSNEDGGFDPIEIYDIQIPYDAEEE